MAKNFYINLSHGQQLLIRKCIKHMLNNEMLQAWDVIRTLMDDEGLGDNPDVRWLVSEYFYRNDASDLRGRRECYECLQDAPDHPFALTLYGQMMMTDGCYDVAIDYFNRALRAGYPSEECRWLSDSVFLLQRNPAHYIAEIIKRHAAEVTAKKPGPIEAMQTAIARFSVERDWDQFHNGKDLAIGLNIEASELLEAFLWKSPEDVDISKVREELADVFNYALQIATKYNLDVYDIVMEKLRRNAEKYPIDKAYGRADKYNEL